jgi:PPK2 family polyphosphate:nucleotide phosphotransferase
MPDLRSLRKALRVSPRTKVDLRRLDPGTTFGHEKGPAELGDGLTRLARLQDCLWAEEKHAVLVVLQGIDAAGKDGTIRHVMGAFNPQGCPVTSFRAPSPLELAHDYLWRVHQRVPAKGEIAIFNRSHYEDVLIARVHGLVPKTVWAMRYGQINAFEEMLASSGTTIVKFFLFISKDEQRDRIQARYDDPRKRWKFSMADLEERAHWDDYLDAYEAVLSRTSTAWAPWYIIPANRNWFRNLAVADILADTLEELRPAYPPLKPGVPEQLVIS